MESRLPPPRNLGGQGRLFGPHIEENRGISSGFQWFLTCCQWPFQDPKLEVPTIYKAYFSGLCKGISPQYMAKHMVRLRTSILES